MNGYCNDNGQKALFDRINEVSFAIDDLRLYLDTHPDCAEALALFAEYTDKRAELIGEYTGKYGPLDSYHVNTADGWNWNTAPMPWMKEANK